MNSGKLAGLSGALIWLLFGSLMLGLASLAVAQSSAPAAPPPPPGPMMMGGPGPHIMMHDEIGEGKVVTGVPMSGVVVVTRNTTLADGNHISTQTQTKVYRDADGRVRREIGFELNTPATGAAKRSLIVINDPVAGKRYMLNPQTKTAHVMSLHAPKQGQGPPPPPDGQADANISREQLGTKAINGLQAEGTRVTRTIPAGKIGNEQPIVVVTERWYSTDLQLPLTTTHTDPMMGTVTTNLTNITRTAPDPSLFQVPSDYKTVSGRQDDVMYMPMKP
jgi:hypothetical protein